MGLMNSFSLFFFFSPFLPECRVEFFLNFFFLPPGIGEKTNEDCVLFIVCTYFFLYFTPHHLCSKPRSCKNGVCMYTRAKPYAPSPPPQAPPFNRYRYISISISCPPLIYPQNFYFFFLSLMNILYFFG